MNNNLSFWERSNLLNFDLIVVGGGIVGHFTALFYAQKHPEAYVAILERGLLPSGASTKNAGFACFGSIAELEDDIEAMGPEATVGLVMKRYEGLRLLRETLGDGAIDYKEVGGYELTWESVDLERVAFFNDLLEPALGARPYSDATAQLRSFGFGPSVKGLVKNSLEGTIHTGKMMRALQRKVAQAGVQTFTQTKVLGVDDGGDNVHVRVQAGENEVVFEAGKVAICTNAFAKDLLPDAVLEPGRGMVLVSKPLQGFNLEGSFHYHNGYHYFRTEESRLILGGGRQLDKAGETTTAAGLNPKIKAQLIEDMEAIVGPGRNLEVDYMWSGTMAFGPNKQPIVERVSPRVVAGVRLGGMGVAVGAGIGHQLSQLLDN